MTDVAIDKMPSSLVADAESFRRRLRRWGRSVAMSGGLLGVLGDRAVRHRFVRKFGSVYGAFPTFKAARAAAGALPTSFDQEAFTREYDDRLDRSFLYDYPVIFHLSRIMGHGDIVIGDLGGHVGLHYYAYRSKIDLDAVFEWRVCDVPAVTAAGRELACQRGVASKLRFIDALQELDGCDVLISAGALQYIERPRLHELIAGFSKRPRHVIVNKVPLYSGPDIVTLQNGRVAYPPHYLFNREAFLASMNALGYKIVDEWLDPSITCYVPLHPARCPAYSGLVFQLEKAEA